MVASRAWPNRPLRIVIPFPPGGGADTIARLVAIKMSEMLGKQVIVESKPGAGGNIASELVARSAPDGYTMFLAGDHLATSNHLNPKVSFDPVRDFEPISLIVQYPIVMAMPANSPDKTLADFIARGRSEPGKLTYGSPGAGAVPHLSGELLVRARQAQDGQRAISRRGARHPGSHPGPHRFILEQHRAAAAARQKDDQAAHAGGDHREALADAAGRAAIGEDVPGYDVTGWYALFVPGKTPKDIIQKMYTRRQGGDRRPGHPEAAGRPGHDRRSARRRKSCAPSTRRTWTSGGR